MMSNTTGPSVSPSHYRTVPGALSTAESSPGLGISGLLQSSGMSPSVMGASGHSSNLYGSMRARGGHYNVSTDGSGSHSSPLMSSPYYTLPHALHPASSPFMAGQNHTLGLSSCLVTSPAQQPQPGWSPWPASGSIPQYTSTGSTSWHAHSAGLASTISPSAASLGTSARMSSATPGTPANPDVHGLSGHSSGGVAESVNRSVRATVEQFGSPSVVGSGLPLGLPEYDTSLNQLATYSNYIGSVSGQYRSGPTLSMQECVKCGAAGSSETMTWQRDASGYLLCASCWHLQSQSHEQGGSSIYCQSPSLNFRGTPSYCASAIQGRPPRICSNCGCMKSTLWRRNVHDQPVCNACGLYFKLHGTNRPISMRKDTIQTRKRKSKTGSEGQSRKSRHSDKKRSTVPSTVRATVVVSPDNAGISNTEAGSSSFQLPTSNPDLSSLLATIDTTAVLQCPPKQQQNQQLQMQQHLHQQHHLQKRQSDNHFLFPTDPEGPPVTPVALEQKEMVRAELSAAAIGESYVHPVLPAGKTPDLGWHQASLSSAAISTSSSSTGDNSRDGASSLFYGNTFFTSRPPSEGMTRLSALPSISVFHSKGSTNSDM